MKKLISDFIKTDISNSCLPSLAPRLSRKSLSFSLLNLVAVVESMCRGILLLAITTPAETMHAPRYLL